MMSACSSSIRANESSAARIRALPARFRALAEKQRMRLSPRFCHLTKPGCFLLHFIHILLITFVDCVSFFCRIYACFTLFFLSVYFVSKIGHFVYPAAQRAAKLL